MLRRLSTHLLPSLKHLHFKPILPYSNHNYNPPPHQEWRQFPLIPFYSSNTKLGLFLGIPALAGYLIPHEAIFDVAATALALATIPTDRKFYTMNPHAPPPKVYGRELTSKLVSQSAYALSCLLSFGLFGEMYFVSSIYMVAGYLIFMGTYRFATEFIPPEKLTKSQLVALGSLVSSTLLYAVTDLSDIAEGPLVDLSMLMPFVYLPYSYFFGKKFIDIFEDASRAMNAQSIDPNVLEGEDKLQRVLKQLDSWKLEHHLTKFLIVYKWGNIGAYLILLITIALGQRFGVRESPRSPQDLEDKEKMKD